MRIFLVLIFSVLTVIGAQLQAFAAEDVPTAFSASLTGGGYRFGSEAHRNSPIYGLKFGYDIIGRDISDSLGIEGGLSFLSTQPSNDPQATANTYLFRIDALYPFLPRSRVVPYLVLGVGGLFIDGPNSSQSPVLNFGAGVKYYLQEFVAVRADIRQVFVFDSERHRNFEYTTGLCFILDRNKNLVRIPIVDTDGDGVPDNLDLCPKTPRGVKVDKDGCPIDSDGDGVPDYQDKCPDTPRGVKVDKEGCPEVKEPVKTPEPIEIQPVPKPQDACTPCAPPPEPIKIPETPLIAPIPEPAAFGAKEKALESVIEKKVMPSTMTMVVEFDTDKADIKSKYLNEVKKFGSFLKINGDVNLIIEGHTDGRGSAEHNIKLSRKRANSIKDLFVKAYDIDPARIIIQAFGFIRPIADNKTDQGRQRNRRAVALTEDGKP